MNDEWVLKAEGLSPGHGGRPLFRDLSFTVGRGEILGIVGTNGCGKTTLLRTFLGLLEPIAGRVERRPGLAISYVPQRQRIEPIVPVSVLEVALMGPGARRPALQRLRNSDYEAAHGALSLLDIDSLAPELFRNLSTGQQQRVLLARALAGDPDLLVLDEPTSGMDVGSEAAILDLLQDLNRSRRVTILLVTHQLPIVLNFATSVLLMGARTILQGAIDDVLHEDRLAALYGAPIRLGTLAGQRTLVVEHSTRSV